MKLSSYSRENDKNSQLTGDELWDEKRSNYQACEDCECCVCFCKQINVIRGALKKLFVRAIFFFLIKQ